MLSGKKEIVEELNKILPTYYELICDSNTKLPCFTYIEFENEQDKTGDTLGYSIIGYTIKLWADKVSDVDNYAIQLDKAMRKLGYRRRSSNELTVDNQIEKIMTYEALALEKFDKGEI